MNVQNKPGAKVFISCGQQEKEMRVVRLIADLLSSEGFQPYVAKVQNSMKGLKENIFRELSNSEYFLFVDFKRDTLVTCDQERNISTASRGSLFSHQELAIAAFLDIDAVGFQHKDLRREGVLDVIQLNCDSFDDDLDLLERIKEKIQKNRWRADWKAQLYMNRLPTEHSDGPHIFHIEVTNLHWRKPAIDCRGYIHEVKEVGKSTPFPFQKFELKWAGTSVPNVTIMPQECRRFDAFVFEADPLRLCWPKGHSFADTCHVWPKVNRPGQYEITYLLTSLNFGPVLGTFRLNLDGDVHRTSLSPVRSDATTLAESELLLPLDRMP